MPEQRLRLRAFTRLLLPPGFRRLPRLLQHPIEQRFVFERASDLDLIARHQVDDDLHLGIGMFRTGRRRQCLVVIHLITRYPRPVRHARNAPCCSRTPEVAAPVVPPSAPPAAPAPTQLRPHSTAPISAPKIAPATAPPAARSPTSV